jgi:O-antigen ligase
VRFNSHNQYVDLIAQTGFLGLVCFLWFFGAVGWLSWQLREKVPAGFARAYVYGAIGGVAGTLAAAAFGDWVIPFFYNINLGGFRASMLSWLFLGWWHWSK